MTTVQGKPVPKNRTKTTITVTKDKQENPSDDYIKSRGYKRRGTKNLSDKELKELTQRLQLEKQLNDLDPSDFKRGMNVVKQITAAGTTLASLYALSKTPLFQDVVKAVKATKG
jgi:hypothetical protein